MPSYKELVDSDTVATPVPEEVLRETADFFHANEGELYPKAMATRVVASRVGVSRALAQRAVDNLALDSVDPVVQVKTSNTPHVGVVDFAVEDFYYTYTDHHDVLGELRRAVCASCVNEGLSASAVHHYTRPADAYDPAEARGLLAAHYYLDHAEMHLQDVAIRFARRGATPPTVRSVEAVAAILDPDKVNIDVAVETGATLLTGSTVGGNLIITSANGSDLNIETLVTGASEGTVPQANADGTLEMVQVNAPSGNVVAGSLIGL